MMKKNLMIGLMLSVLTGILGGCGQKEVTIEQLKDTKVEKYVTVEDGYKALTVSVQPKVEVTQEDVTYYIQSSSQQIEELHNTDPTIAVKNGDMVNIDYAGSVDGEYFEGGTAQDQFLGIGSGRFIDGFEEGLIGAKVGDEVILNLTFPEQYHEELAGKDCVFEVTINYIIDEITDENVSLLDEAYTSVDAYKADVMKTLQAYYDSQYEYSVDSQIASSLLGVCTFKEIPQTLVEDFVADLKEDYTVMAESVGMTLEDYIISRYGVAQENVETTIRSVAEGCAKEGVALQYIANREKLNISDEELESELQKAQKEGGYATMDQLLEEVGGKEMVRWNLMYNKVYQYLKDNAIITNN